MADAMKALAAFDACDLVLSPDLNDALNSISYPRTRIVALSGSMHKLTVCKSLDFVFSASSNSLILLPRHISAMLFERRENVWVLAGVLETETPFPSQNDVIVSECCAPHVDDVVVAPSTFDRMFAVQKKIDPLLQVLSSGITVHDALQMEGIHTETRMDIEGVLRQFGTCVSVRMANELYYAGARVYAKILKMLLEVRESLFERMSPLPDWDESVRKMQILYDSDTLVRKRRMDWDCNMRVLIDLLPHVKVLVKESNILDALRNHCACYAWPTLQSGLNVIDISPMNAISHQKVRSSKLKDTYIHVQSFWMDRLCTVTNRFENLDIAHPTYKCVMLLSVGCWMMTLLSGNQLLQPQPQPEPEPQPQPQPESKPEPEPEPEQPPESMKRVEDDCDMYEDLEYDSYDGDCN